LSTPTNKFKFVKHASFCYKLQVNRSEMDFLEPIKFQFIVFRAMGLWPSRQDSSSYIIYGILIHIGSSVLHIIPLLHEAFRATDITEAAYIIIFMLIEITYLFKVFVLILKADKIREVTREITKIDYQPITTADNNILLQGLSKWRNGIKTYFRILVVVLLFRFISFGSSVSEARLPVVQWFFGLDWQHNKAIYIAIVLLYCVIAVVRVTVHNLFNLFSLYLIFFTINQNKMICARIAKLNGPLYHVIFVKNIKIDQKLNQILENVEKLFSSALFVQLSVMAVIIGLLSHQLSNLSLVDFIFFGFYLIMTLVQLFLPCYIGHELMCSSQDIGCSIYNSNWLSLRCRQRQDIIIGIMKSTRPRIFIANHWFVLSLPTVTAVS
jgi:hypothetical protein